MEKKPYKLYLAGGKNPPQGAIVGDFKKRDDEGFVCEIIISDLEVRKSGGFDVTTVMFPDKAIMYVSADILDALQQDGKEELFELYHELGHIHCGHYNVEIDPSAAPDIVRIKNEEFEADAFAARMLGKDSAVDALRETLKIRAEVDKRLKVNGTPDSVKAIREIRARIENIKNL